MVIPSNENLICISHVVGAQVVEGDPSLIPQIAAFRLALRYRPRAIIQPSRTRLRGTILPNTTTP